MKINRHLSLVIIFFVSVFFHLQTSIAGTRPYLADLGINFATGNKYVSKTDYRIETSGVSLSFDRSYNSQVTTSSILGYGWTTTGLEHLQVTAENIILVEQDGRYVYFFDNGQGQWINESGKQRVITTVGSDYLLTEYNGATKTFDSNHRLVRKTDKNNNSLTYTYTGDELTAVSDNFGHTLSFSYTSGKLTTLSTPAGDFIYTYAGDNLTSVTKPDGTSRQYIYDDPNDSHNLTGIIDENGTRILTVAYDDQDRAVSGSLADGTRQKTINYQSGLQRIVKNSLDVATTYQLEEQHGIGLVTSFTGPGCLSCGEGSSGSYTYNDRLQVLSKTNGQGIVTSYIYDSRGNRTSQTEAEGTALERVTTWTYEADSSRIAEITKKSVVDPAQNTSTAYTYDTNGNISTISRTGILPGGSTQTLTTTYSYDTLGRLAAIDGPRTDVVDSTVFVYYANDAGQGLNRGMLKKITNAVAHETIFSDYNEFGRPETITSPNGTVTLNSYNAAGLLLSSTTDGVATGFEYFPNGRMKKITGPGPRVISYQYTSAGFPEKITDSLGNFRNIFYDSEGNKTREENRDPSNSLRFFLRYTYEDSGRLDKIINPDDSFTTFDYDNNGNLISLVNAVNQTTSYSYDSLNRLTRLTEPGTTFTTFDYDTSNNTTTVTDPESHATLYAFDDFGHRLTRNSPDTGQTVFSYDEAGNIHSETDAEGIETTYEYDALNRLVAISYPDTSQDILYSYDQGLYGTGHLSGMSSNGGDYVFSYDALGNLISENSQIGGHSYSSSYTYNQSGQITSITYPGGRTVDYTYNSTGNITRVTTSLSGATVTIADNISYLPYGPLQHLEYGNSIVYDAVYDQMYHMTGQTAGSILNRGYTLNAIGNVTAVTDNLASGNNQSFSYDSLNRLTSESGNYGSIAYGNDKAGNRLSTTVSGVTTTYSYETETNRLTSIGGEGRSYAANGLTTSSDNNRYSYSYNYGRRLEALSEKKGSMFFVLPIRDQDGQVNRAVVNFLGKHRTTHYLYDGFGRRTRSILPADSGTYDYHYAGDGKLLGFSHYNSDDTLLSRKEFIWLGNTPVAQADTEYNQDGSVESSNMVWLQTDHLNTPLMATNATGTVVWRWDRNAFGTVAPDTDPDGDGIYLDIPLRFPGQIKMPGDGKLTYNWHRYYDPEIGRYVSADPIGLDGGINLYAYVHNDPVNAVDPWGLSGYSIAIRLGMGFGGIGVAAFPIPGARVVAATMIAGALMSGDTAIGQNPISHTIEDELLNWPTPGYPEDPDDYCPKIKHAIDKLNKAINWRGLDLRRNVNGLSYEEQKGHRDRIKNLKDKRDELQRKYDDFCKPCS